jgi:hypothetical protein
LRKKFWKCIPVHSVTKIPLYIYICVCVYVCVRACVRERERETSSSSFAWVSLHPSQMWMRSNSRGRQD